MLLNSAVAPPAPEEGQLVSVRDRHWIVKSVLPSALPADIMSAGDQRQHLVQLSSVEDDGLGEELSVIWEIEPAATVHETGNFPVPVPGHFDDPQRLDTFLDAVRWGAIASADARALQAPFRSGITIEDYQLDPVVRALGMARVNLLIADDVGLGKTIEAGLIAQEMILRHRVRSVLILCPPHLCTKWQLEMRDRFGLEFRIVDAEAVRRLRRERGRSTNIFGSFPRLIASYDWLKLDRGMSLLRKYLGSDQHAYPRKIDLLVVDEVHQCAPAGSGTYAMPSLRTQLLREIGPHAEHRLFLSATPHNGYPSSFLALLELLDPQRFNRGAKPDEASLRNAVVRRMKSEIRELGDAAGEGRFPFPVRRVEKIDVDYPESERAVHADLATYTALRRRNADANEQLGADLVTLLLKKRLFSSPAAFARTLERHLQSLGKRALPKDAVRLRAAYDLDGDDFDTEDAREDAADDAVDGTTVGRPMTPEERALLDRMREWANANARRADEKARALIAQLKAWGHERVIVFTEYRATQEWLRELLAAQGLGTHGRVQLLYGGMDDEERERITAAFQSDPGNDPVRVLIATDTASEGIDLQRHCRRIVHLDIPFNPNRLEQRNGRIDRHGQPSPEVFIYHFASKALGASGPLDGDLDFLFRAAKKMETIRDDLGNAGAVLAKQVEDALLGRPVDFDAPLDQGRSESRAALRAEINIRERVKEMHEQLLESRDTLNVTPQAMERVVAAGFDLARQKPLERVELTAAYPGGPKLEAYNVPELTGSWARAGENLIHPVTNARLPITFDNAGADGREDVVLGHLGHRLVAQATRLLRAQVWALPEDAKIARISGRLVNDAALAEPVAILTARIVIIGAEGYRLHEALFNAGGRITPRFSRYNVGQIDAALRAAGSTALPLHHQEEIVAAWGALQPSLVSAMEARAKDLLSSLKRSLGERADADVKNLTEVMLQLQTSIQRELASINGGQPDQLGLFDERSESERKQRRSDIDTMRRRGEEIPQEIERETERLRRRYGDPREIVFPAAVSFLVPRRFADGNLGIEATR
jgi:superfamily II DNA or RNA helicase